MQPQEVEGEEGESSQLMPEEPGGPGEEESGAWRAWGGVRSLEGLGSRSQEHHCREYTAVGLCLSAICSNPRPFNYTS